MPSEMKVNKISPASGTAITLGDSGDTFTIPSGATITNSGTQNGFGSTSASDLSSGTLPMARLSGTLPALNGSALTALNATQLTSGTIPIARIADDAVTLAKMADDAIGVAQLSATGTASNSTFLRGDNAWAAAGGGKVLQVVNTQLNVGTNGVSQNVFVDSAINGSITPSATGSRILIMVHFVATQYNTSGDGGWSLRFKQAISGGATSYPEVISTGQTASNHTTMNYWGGTETYNRYVHETVHFVASPNTTSAVTYTLQYGTYNMEGFSIGNIGTGGKTTLTLIEIGA